MNSRLLGTGRWANLACLVQRGRCTSYSYPYVPEKVFIGGTAPPPYHSGKAFLRRTTQARKIFSEKCAAIARQRTPSHDRPIVFS